MKRPLPMFVWALAGVFLIAGLTGAAVAAAGKTIAPPARQQFSFIGNRVEPAAGEAPGVHGSKDDHGSGTNLGAAGDDQGGNSGSGESSGSGSGGSGSGSGSGDSHDSGGSSGGSGDSGGDHGGGEGDGGGDD